MPTLQTTSPPPPLPVTDWQFWVVSIVALVAAAWILRRLIPNRLRRPHKRSGAKRATLTIGGRSVEGAGAGDRR